MGPSTEYNEEEEERKYYRRKRLGVIKNVLAASFGAMIVYSVYMGESDGRKNDCWGARTCSWVCACGCLPTCRTAADATHPPLRHDVPRGEVQQPRTGGHRPQDLDGHQCHAGHQFVVHPYTYQVDAHKHSQTHARRTLLQTLSFVALAGFSVLSG